MCVKKVKYHIKSNMFRLPLILNVYRNKNDLTPETYHTWLGLLYIARFNILTSSQWFHIVDYSNLLCYSKTLLLTLCSFAVGITHQLRMPAITLFSSYKCGFS